MRIDRAVRGGNRNGEAAVHVAFCRSNASAPLDPKRRRKSSAARRLRIALVMTRRRTSARGSAFRTSIPRTSVARTLLRTQWAILALAAVGAPIAEAQRDPYRPPDEGPGHDMIESFEAEVFSNRRVELVWSFRASRAGERITCTVDPESDGIAEYTIEDCAVTRRQAHRFDEPGDYAAALLATDREGRSDRATVSFTVR
jgi:hypothetical protein